MAALQDCFVDADGSCFVYEISVRHCEARGTSVCMVTYIQTYIHTYLYVLGLPDYVTADVMCLLYVARPVKGSKNMCEITIISQVSHINLCMCMYVCMYVCICTVLHVSQVDTRSKNWNLLSFLPSSKKDGSNAIGNIHAYIHIYIHTYIHTYNDVFGN